jgi:hypothetical protein
MNLKNGMKKFLNKKSLIMLLLIMLIILFLSLCIYGIIIKDYFIIIGNILNVILYILIFVDIVC